MPRIAYVDGRYVPLRTATLPLEDRAGQFADAVYEVTAVFGGRMLDWAPHVARLRRSREALGIDAPMDDAALTLVAERLLGANRTSDALLYLQLSRGAAKRDHAWPVGARPSLAMTVRPFDFGARRWATTTVATMPDERWARPEIKSVSLLPNVLGKERARAAGAGEAWFVRDGVVTEGGSTNAWIVDGEGRLRTHPRGGILEGVMRAALLRVAEELGVAVEQRAFSVDEAVRAPEAFLTSTTNPCVPVVAIDSAAVADAKAGPVTAALREALWAEIARATGWTAPI